MQWYQMRFEANFWLLHLLLLGIIRQQTIDASLIESRDGYLRSSTQNYYQRSKITVDNFSKKKLVGMCCQATSKIGLYLCEGIFSNQRQVSYLRFYMTLTFGILFAYFFLAMYLQLNRSFLGVAFALFPVSYERYCLERRAWELVSTVY